MAAITDLAAASSVGASDNLVINQAGIDKKVTADKFAVLAAANDFAAAQRVIGASVGALMASSGNGRAIRHVGAVRAATMSVGNGQAFTITFDGDACLFAVELGYAALLFVTYNSTTVVELADPDGIVPGFITVTKSGSSRVVTLTNVSGSSRNVSILALGAITAFTNPA